MREVLSEKTQIRLLPVADIFTRKSVVLAVDYGVKTPQLVDASRIAVSQRGPRPERCFSRDRPVLLLWNHPLVERTSFSLRKYFTEA